MFVINSNDGLLVEWTKVGSGYGYRFDPTATEDQAIVFPADVVDKVVRIINGPKNWSWKDSWVTCWKKKKRAN